MSRRISTEITLILRLMFNTNSFHILGQTASTLSEECGSSFESWTRPQTLLLIELYSGNNEKFQNPLVKKKALWEEITKSLNSRGYNYTTKQVEGRWKTLTAAYRRVKDNNNSTGRGKKTLEFEQELDEIFAERHDTKPTFVISSSSPSASSSSSATEVAELSDSGEPSEKVGVGKRKRKSQSASTKVIDFLKDYGEQEDKREKERMEKAERMHGEKMSLFKSLLDVMNNQK